MSTTDTGKVGKAADTSADDLGAAGSQLSTAPREDTLNMPSLGIVGWARWFWRQLTSMRVALLLLFLLSLAAIPGSVIPQSGQDETKVADFIERHETLGPLYEKLGLFHVYGSVWFSAIYILLFISLIGCIVPRTWQFVGQLTSLPPGAPRRLTRLPAYASWRTDAEPDRVREIALTTLKGRRFRAHTVGEAVAAEKGYLRESGNLAFHLALIVMLIAFAWGQLFKSEGNKLIVEGDGFSNTPTQYDDFKSGSLFTFDDLKPFSFNLKEFKGTYERSGPNKGTPRTYEADITYGVGARGEERATTIKVNEPLDIDGSKVYLTAHGYAPVITVRDGEGKVVFSEPVPLLPLDSNVTSSGAVKVLDGYRSPEGTKEQLGFNAFFVPTFAGKGKGQMVSQFPALDFPVLALSAYHGDVGVDSGIPQNIYQLNTAKMKEFKDSGGELFKKQLTPGGTMELPGGAGSVTFDGVKEWANFQVTEQPASGWALTGAVAAVLGLAGSLFVQRRRVWVRAVRGADGVTVVEMAGLGRSESARLPEELGELADLIHAGAPTRQEAEAAEAGADADADAEDAMVAENTDPEATPKAPADDPQAAPADAADRTPDPDPDRTPDPDAAPLPEPGAENPTADPQVVSAEGADTK